MKKIILILLLAFVIACKNDGLGKKSQNDTALVLIEFSGKDFSKDVIINLKERYIVYANKGYTIAVKYKKDYASDDSRFNLNDEDLKNINNNFNAIDKNRNAVNDSELHTSIESVEENKVFKIIQNGKHHMSGESTFLKTVLSVINSKTKDEKIKKELHKFLLLMA